MSEDMFCGDCKYFCPIVRYSVYGIPSGSGEWVNFLSRLLNFLYKRTRVKPTEEISIPVTLMSVMNIYLVNDEVI